MILATCQHDKTHKHGKDRQGNQRYKCALCNATFVEPTAKPFGDLRISLKDATTILGLLLEGASIRAAERLTGVCRKTICDLILVVGDKCERLLRSKIQNVEAKDVQLDEIWSFVGMKEKTRVATARGGECGDSWTFIAIDRDTKLVLTHAIGQRDMATWRPALVS